MSCSCFVSSCCVWTGHDGTIWAVTKDWNGVTQAELAKLVQRLKNHESDDHSKVEIGGVRAFYQANDGEFLSGMTTVPGKGPMMVSATLSGQAILVGYHTSSSVGNSRGDMLRLITDLKNKKF